MSMYYVEKAIAAGGRIESLTYDELVTAFCNGSETLETSKDWDESICEKVYQKGPLAMCQTMGFCYDDDKNNDNSTETI